MDRREFLKLGLVSLTSASVPLPIYHYLFSGNSDEVLKFHIAGILENQVEIETISNFLDPITEKETKTKTLGDGTIVNYLGEDYIFTVDHLTYIDELKTNSRLFGPFKVPIKKMIKEETKLGFNLLERVFRDKSRDITAFRLPKEYKAPDYKVRLADSDKIEVLDKVYLLGRPLRIRRNIREGIVSNKIGVTRFPDGKEEEGFNISIAGYYGDSGTPTINSYGEITGFFSQFHFSVISSFIRPINWYKEAIDEAKDTESYNNSIHGVFG